jgi:hypothetical protein
MTVTANSIITAQAPYAVNADLTAITACTTRAPTATASLAAANIIAFVPVSTNGCRIDNISVKAASTAFTAASVAQTITLWEWDGTKAYPIREIVTTIVTPSTTAASYESGLVPINIVLPATHALYLSTSITTTAATTAMVVTAYGALL